jgi:hypothetical protein
VTTRPTGLLPSNDDHVVLEQDFDLHVTAKKLTGIRRDEPFQHEVVLSFTEARTSATRRTT